MHRFASITDNINNEVTPSQPNTTSYDLGWVNSPLFPKWLADHHASLIVSSYNSHQVYSIGCDPNMEKLTFWVTQHLRPMGLGSYSENGKTIVTIGSLGRVYRYVNVGPIDHPQFGPFNPTFTLQNVSITGNADIHDLRPTATDTYFALAKFNCIAKLSPDKSFQVYYVPPWITYNKQSDEDFTNLPFEDRCHLNGLCIVDGKPKYITVASMTDYPNSWRELQNQPHGAIIDITDNTIYCPDIYSPHSPRMYYGPFTHNGKTLRETLWVLESGTGHLGFVDDNKFVPMKFIAGFLRGLDFIDHYAVVTTSLDRHDHSFKDIPLSKHLSDNNMPAKCGVWVIDLHGMNVVEFIEFTAGVTELYDVTILKNIGLRPHMYEIFDEKLLTTFIK
jgi:uncharacterized protein (TIGR03032 family)